MTFGESEVRAKRFRGGASAYERIVALAMRSGALRGELVDAVGGYYFAGGRERGRSTRRGLGALRCVWVVFYGRGRDRYIVELFQWDMRECGVVHGSSFRGLRWFRSVAMAGDCV
jgi:hypothetical protein